ncbi:winged helix-turn-helix transcriptional regulator [Candidatus Bathyarchaeota archaeon]|nr:MAG: winged helix-turn-helix transcriptional regulator [Candidatus Bathyarchaeota archaeon]
MDDVDRRIISELLKDGRASYKKLGDIVGYTIMGVKRRVEKMLSKGIIEVSAGINIEALNLYAALILLELESREALNACLQRFKECPRVVSMFTLLAGYNLAVLVIAEDRDTLESESMEKCSLRCMPGVRRTEFYPIGSIHYSPFLKVRLDLVTQNREKAPCDVNCNSCVRYQIQKCVGCPATKYYRGPL